MWIECRRCSKIFEEKDIILSCLYDIDYLCKSCHIIEKSDVDYKSSDLLILLGVFLLILFLLYFLI